MSPIPRREVRQLKVGDQVLIACELKWEVADVESVTAEQCTLLVQPLPCGPQCGAECACNAAGFAADGPYRLRLSAKQRVPFLGNLQELLADSERIQAQIQQLQGTVPAFEIMPPANENQE